jgi:hypothetical protein
MDRLSKSLYGWGTVLALGHYVFGPMVRGSFLSPPSFPSCPLRSMCLGSEG